MTFTAKGDEETKGKNNAKSTKKLLVSPSIQEFNNTAIFLEKDPACQSGLVCGGNCLARHQVCDSLNDCQNGIDEVECNFPTCYPDCRTAEDEVACTASCLPWGEMYSWTAYLWWSCRLWKGRWWGIKAVIFIQNFFEWSQKRYA